MKVTAFVSAGAAEGAVSPEATAVVIDVIRATTTLIEALANGARAVYPTQSTEDALHLASSLGREDTLLCGERKGLKIEGFDLGNSPLEFTRKRVDGKRLVMSTTNGTRAFGAVAPAERVVAAAFVNLGAVARAVATGEVLALVCAGKEGQFSLDDVVCAGHLLRRLQEAGTPLEMNDAAAAALELSGSLEASPGFLKETAAGRALMDVGLEADLPLCAQVDRHEIVPEMRERMILLPDEDA